MSCWLTLCSSVLEVLGSNPVLSVFMYADKQLISDCPTRSVDGLNPVA